jgi:hypothetical protein
VSGASEPLGPETPDPSDPTAEPQPQPLRRVLFGGVRREDAAALQEDLQDESNTPQRADVRVGPRVLRCAWQPAVAAGGDTVAIVANLCQAVLFAFVGLAAATEREPNDFTEGEVLFGERYYERFRLGAVLSGAAYELLRERWTRVHSSRQRRAPEQLRWRVLNELTAFLAEQDAGRIRLGDQPLDEDELAEGQLVLLAASATEAGRAGTSFVYRLPRLELDLRIEDSDRERLLIDCGEQDPARVWAHLQRLPARDRCLSRDDQGTAMQIERARWAMRSSARRGSRARRERALRDPAADPGAPSARDGALPRAGHTAAHDGPPPVRAHRRGHRADRGGDRRNTGAHRAGPR